MNKEETAVVDLGPVEVAHKSPGTELIEVSPAVLDLLEQVRDLADVGQLSFYRRILRRGALGEFGAEGGTYGLIGELNKGFLEDKNRCVTANDLEALSHRHNAAVAQLLQLKRRITAL